MNARAESTNGAESDPIPRPAASRLLGPIKFGPATDPIVIAHRTIDIACAWFFGVTSSVAAKRDCKLVATADPKQSILTSNNQNCMMAAASRTRPAP